MTLQRSAISNVLFARFGKVFEQFAHFLGGFDVVAGAVEFESARLVQRGAGVDAQHGVLRAGVFGTRVMGIVGWPAAAR